MKTIIIGTRGSPLALAQAQIITGLLQKAHPGLNVERKITKTTGDRFMDMSLSGGGGKGLFTKEIEDQLLAGETHLAVHSMKDLPTQMPAGLTIGATPAREDPHDVLVSTRYRSVDELPKGARVATSSVRRKVQLLARRPDLQILEIRGNIGTRLEKTADFDAIILAAAGLKRLGLKAEYSPLSFDVMIPAVGQGIIACQVREADFETQELLAPINDADTLACAETERVFLRALGGGCQLPYAGHATVTGKQMRLIGARFAPDIRRADVTGSEPHEVGERAAKQILR